MTAKIKNKKWCCGFEWELCAGSRALTAVFVPLGEQRERGLVQRRAGAQRVRLRPQQLLPLLQAQLLLVQPLLDQEDFRHLRALIYTSHDPVRLCHSVSNYHSVQSRGASSTLVSIVSLHGQLSRVAVVYLLRVS